MVTPSRTETRLAAELSRNHPDRAAAVLDALGEEEATRALAALPERVAASVLTRLATHSSRAVLGALDPERGAALVDTLDADAAARLLRILPQDRRARVLEALPEARRSSLEALLRFPESTAGALMDPGVMALHDDLTVREMLSRIRKDPEHARYNVYIVDRDHVLVGVVNLRELLIARPGTRVAAMMHRKPMRIRADASRAAVLSHPAWRLAHSVPVVDARGVYLGAIRYRTLRRLEEETRFDADQDASAAEALGDLFAAGAAGVLDAVGGSSPKHRGGKD